METEGTNQPQQPSPSLERENDFDRYQRLAMVTCAKESIDETIKMCALGLGELGEVQGLIKKHYYHGHDLPMAKILDELGDCMWYMAVLCNTLGFDFSDVADINVRKLKSRYPEGFSHESSINRTN